MKNYQLNGIELSLLNWMECFYKDTEKLMNRLSNIHELSGLSYHSELQICKEDYKELKHRIREKEKEENRCFKRREYSESPFVYQAMRNLLEAAASGFNEPVTCSDPSRLYSATEEAHYKISKSMSPYSEILRG